jgi:hypothetical protein
VQSTSIGASSPENENPAGASNTAGPDDLERSQAVSTDLAKKPTEEQAELPFANDEERIKAIADGKYVPGRGEAKAEMVKAQPLADVIKLPRPEHPDHVLTSLPLVRHWLFAPDKTKLRIRKFQVEASIKGHKVMQSLTIGDDFSGPNKGYGVLTTRHQRALFVLQHLWQQQGGHLATLDGKRSAVLTCSSWQLEEHLFGSHGGEEKRMAKRIIHELNSIPIKIENYVDRDGYVSNFETNGLIRGYTFASSRRVQDGQMGFPWVEIYLGPLVVKAFEENEIKPLHLGVVRGFKSDIAALLYPKLDYLLSLHDETEHRLDGLVQKLGLTGEQLEQRSYRLRKFNRPIEELKGKPLSSGGELLVDVKPTTDGQDWKLVATRSRK